MVSAAERAPFNQYARHKNGGGKKKEEEGGRNKRIKVCCLTSAVIQRSKAVNIK